MEESQIGNLIISLLTGLIISLAGYLMRKHPPKYINPIYGYRTKKSMTNQLLWDEANKYSAEIMLKYGAIFAIAGALLSLVIKGIMTTVIIFGILILLIIRMFIKVENRLKKLDL